MIRNSLVALVALVTVSGCPATPPIQWDTEPPALNAGQVNAIKNAVRQKLKDEHSVEFEDVNAMWDEDGVVTVCGKVNVTGSAGDEAELRRFKATVTSDNEAEVVGVYSHHGFVTLRVC